ncbi:MAG: DUF4387 domain-containing protein [Ruminococcaceae bacterium]|nr:DUF4387 domain-containing protein [Oscillospiraceae bacterium]
MKKLIDYTKILRSKNAGPLFITFDLIFHNREDMYYISRNLTKAHIAKAYDVPKEKIHIIVYEVVNSIKITFPGKNISGSLGDNDVYRCQQHINLANIII